MCSYIEKIDKLVEKECFIIDFLPKTVPVTSKGYFFEVEDYLLNNKNHNKFYKKKFERIILKLMCYYNVKIYYLDKLIEKPKPKLIKKLIDDLKNNLKCDLNLIFNDEFLLVVKEQTLFLEFYNLSEEVMDLLDKISLSEGMFFRKGVK